MIKMIKRGVVLVVGILGLSFVVGKRKVFALDCVEEGKRIHDTLKMYFTGGAHENFFDFEVLEINPLKIGKSEFCEVIWRPVPKGEKGVVDTSRLDIPKQILYLGEGFMIQGEIRLKTEKGVQFLTMSRLYEINKDYYKKIENLRKEQERKDLEKKGEIEKEVNKIKGLVDVELKKGDSSYVVYVFVDPFCPYCEKMKDVLMRVVDEGRVEVGLIMTPVLGERSKRVVESVLCDKKGKDRLKAYQERYMGSGEVCKEGREKVLKNIEMFRKLGARGVPFSIWVDKRSGKVINVVEGAVFDVDVILKKGER